ncbi:cupin domain-containing protein [Thioalkalivibrio paradoxus]|uniref:Cupin n=1 Tax=Thioalkalivibrio paradoxus ARh 1 TaxID=713585 RepID=W0DKS2_9GAMM|nr:cupin domain-containing protein [Thioalkalivibrio paradoxus]AHE99164.1 cupin [Thioalkalivibrio paradoxus ARh 1]
MSGALGNLFGRLPSLAQGEAFEDLLRRNPVRIERIVSSGRPEPTLYDQEQDEWVCLLQGEAELQLGKERVPLQAGDYLFIPAHTPHRVLRTSAEPPCIWLAVHIDPTG